MSELTPSEQARFDRLWKSMSDSRKAMLVIDFDHFCSWLRGEDSSFYYAIRDKLREVWRELKANVGEAAEAFGEGVLKTYASVAVTPVVAVVEGVKEGFKNGLDAGIDKAISESKKFLKDLWS